MIHEKYEFLSKVPSFWKIKAKFGLGKVLLRLPKEVYPLSYKVGYGIVRLLINVHTSEYFQFIIGFTLIIVGQSPSEGAKLPTFSLPGSLDLVPRITALMLGLDFKYAVMASFRPPSKRK